MGKPELKSPLTRDREKMVLELNIQNQSSGKRLQSLLKALA